MPDLVLLSVMLQRIGCSAEILCCLISLPCTPNSASIRRKQSSSSGPIMSSGTQCIHQRGRLRGLPKSLSFMLPSQTSQCMWMSVCRRLLYRHIPPIPLAIPHHLDNTTTSMMMAKAALHSSTAISLSCLQEG